MPRCVDQIQLVTLTILGVVIERDALCLDGDAALALERHGVEHLTLHLARIEPATELDQPIGERGLAVIDVGDDRKVANILHR